MTRKQELEIELAEIKKQEKIEKEQKERNDLISNGFYVPIKFGKIVNTIWYCSEYIFKEIDETYYTCNEILGSPDFKKGDNVVLIKIEDGERRWYTVREDDDYLFIDGDEFGISENSRFVETIIK